MATRFKTAEIGFATAQRVDDLVRYAELAERNGFTSFWLGERYYARGIYTAAAAIAVATRAIKIGLGIVSPFTRHPSLIAMETAALDELSNGRVMLGLGVSQISASRQGVADTRPALSLKETIDIVRGFFAGEGVVYHGKMFEMNQPGSRFVFEPLRADIPIHLGGMGPKSLELAGRAADGEIIGMFATPGFAAYAREPIGVGLTAAGRDWSDFEYRSYLTFCVDDDSDRAKATVRPTLVGYLSGGHSASAAEPGSLRWRHSGISDDELQAVRASVRERVAAGDVAGAAESIPLDFVDRLIVAGTDAECRAKLAEFAEAGLDYPVLYHVAGGDPATAVARAASVIEPLVER